MEKCEQCNQDTNLIFCINSKTLCGKCSKHFLKKKKGKSKRIKTSVESIKPVIKKIDGGDIKRNFQLIREGKALDISLRKIREYGKKKGENLIQRYKWKFNISKECTCKECKNIFLSNRAIKYCSAKCSRRAHNRNCNKRYHEKMQTDWQFAIQIRMRDRLRDAIRFYNATGKFRPSHDYMNYKAIIKKLGPCPGKRAMWHIDHIKPLCKFNFTHTKEIKKAFAPNNLRWLLAKDNLKKGRNNPFTT